MHPVEITFDRVFDVTKDMPGGRKITHFGFESSSTRQPSVVVPGWPKVKSGMRVVALLRRPDDWHRIYGWADLDEGVVVCESPASQFGIALLALFFLAAITAKIDVPSLAQLAVVYVILGGIALFFMAQGIVTFRARRALKQVLRPT